MYTPRHFKFMLQTGFARPINGIFQDCEVLGKGKFWKVLEILLNLSENMKCMKDSDKNNINIEILAVKGLKST